MLRLVLPERYTQSEMTEVYVSFRIVDVISVVLWAFSFQNTPGRKSHFLLIILPETMNKPSPVNGGTINHLLEKATD